MDPIVDLFDPPRLPASSRAVDDGDGDPFILFFALRPPADAIPEISQRTNELFGQFELRGRRQDPDRLHLSVSNPGRPVRLREPLPSALARSLLEFRGPAIEVVLDTAMRYGAIGDHSSLVLVGDADTQQALSRLRRSLADAQVHHGLKAQRAPARAHMTIAHVRDLPNLSAEIAPVRFVAHDLWLVASFPGRHLHRTIAHWALDA
jgi:2'-5' RNA ligase